MGGKIHLLATALFIMLILSVYTANLVAILAQDVNKASVESMKMAVKLVKSVSIKLDLVQQLVKERE